MLEFTFVDFEQTLTHRLFGPLFNPILNIKCKTGLPTLNLLQPQPKPLFFSLVPPPINFLFCLPLCLWVLVDPCTTLAYKGVGGEECCTLFWGVLLALGVIVGLDFGSCLFVLDVCYWAWLWNWQSWTAEILKPMPMWWKVFIIANRNWRYIL